MHRRQPISSYYSGAWIALATVTINGDLPSLRSQLQLLRRRGVIAGRQATAEAELAGEDLAAAGAARNSYRHHRSEDDLDPLLITRIVDALEQVCGPYSYLRHMTLPPLLDIFWSTQVRARHSSVCLGHTSAPPLYRLYAAPMQRRASAAPFASPDPTVTVTRSLGCPMELGAWN